VRRDGEAGWRPHVAGREQRFDAHGLADNGGSWVFSRGPWQMKVATCFVVGRGPAPPKPDRDRGTFDKCVRGRSARGASGRKNRRR